MAVGTRASSVAARTPAEVRASSRWPLPFDVTAAILGAILAATATFVLVVWAYGSPEREIFTTADEATDRLAAQLVTDTGAPVFQTPIDDPEGLLHIRFWYEEDGDVRPAYPPFAFYAYGLAARLGGIGEWLPLIVPSVGLAALAAAGALTLGGRQAPFGALFPLVLFPVSTWMTRAWMNFALFDAALAGIALCLVLWHRTSRFGFFAAVAALTAVAGATRPDQLLWLYGAVYLVALALERHSWRRITASMFVSGGVAVGVVLVLNWAVGGDPLQSGYEELADATASETSRDLLPGPLRTVAYALAPWGFDIGPNGLWQLAKYWLLMMPIGLLTLLGAVGYVWLLRDAVHRQQRELLGLLVALGVLTVLFSVSRLCPGCQGADSATAGIRDSIPRYLALAYMLAGFAALAYMRSHPSRLLRGTLVGLSLFGGLLFFMNLKVERDIAVWLNAETALAERYLPDGTIYYTWYGEKTLGELDGLYAASFPYEFLITRPGGLEEPAPAVPEAAYERLVQSVEASRAQGRPVALSGLHPEHFAEVARRLRADGFRLMPVREIDLTWLVWEQRTVADE